MDTSYAMTKVVLYNGNGDELATYKAGQGVKLYKGLFGDAIVLGFSKVTEYGDIFVKVARPHCNAMGIGTTSPNVALQVEVFVVTLTNLLRDNDGKGAFYPLNKHGERACPWREAMDSEVVYAEVQLKGAPGYFNAIEKKGA